MFFALFLLFGAIVLLFWDRYEEFDNKAYLLDFARELFVDHKYSLCSWSNFGANGYWLVALRRDYGQRVACDGHLNCTRSGRR